MNFENIKTVYLAGPMRGRPELNFPAFDAAKEILENNGLKVISPADLDRDAGMTPEKYLAMSPPEQYCARRRCIGRDMGFLINLCDAVVLLEGWENSIGVNAELGVARFLELPLFELQGDSLALVDLTDETVVRREEVADEDTDGESEWWPDIAPRPESCRERTCAKRHNAGKPRLGYILQFPRFVVGLAAVMAYGAQKYGDLNWQKGGKPDSEYLDACLRHVLADLSGERVDSESGCQHLDHAIWNLMVLRELNR